MTMPTAARAILAFALTLGLLSGCAGTRGPVPPPEYDPLESFNRKMFWFNDEVDTWVLAPAATGWEKVLPRAVRTSVSNFFGNLRTPIVAVNDLLQAKLLPSAKDVGRFAVNTTVGVAGFFDPASRWGLERREQDFGATLGVWGVPAGPYLVLPLLGPSSPRDAGGLAVDTAISVTPFFVDWYYLFGARVLDTVNARSFTLEEVRNAKAAALDYYAFVRKAYLQRRRALISGEAELSPEEQQELYYPHLEEENP